MNNSDYKFQKCFHPRQIRNPYTGDVLTVSCNCCKACLMNRAAKMSMLCSLEEEDNLYCAFITLTYSNLFIPLMKPVYNDTDKCYDLFSVCDRLDESGDLLGSDYLSDHVDPNYMDLLLKKINLDGFIGYASRIDLQRYLKRLRQRIFRKTNEKVRFYAVSEYGPVHFRPHFHILLYFNDPATLACLSEFVHSCWSFGRVDFSISRGKCSSYVSSYVNSRVSLPRLFENNAVCPFSSHSNFFAQEFYRCQKKAIYKDDPRIFMYQCREIGSTLVQFSPWRALTSVFFPKCRGFNYKSFDELYESYTILRECEREFGFTSVCALSRQIVDLVLECVNPSGSIPDWLSSPRLVKILSYFGVSYGLSPEGVPKGTTDFKKYYSNRIYTELFISKRFLYFCCEDSYDYCDRLRTLNKIVDFYKIRDIDNLRDFYYCQESFLRENPDATPFHYLLFYDNTRFRLQQDSDSSDYWLTLNFVRNLTVSAVEKDSFLKRCRVRGFRDNLLKSLKCYKHFYLFSQEKFEKSIKHKVLNDQNRIFCI